MSRIARTSFDGAPTDNLAAVDVYETTTPEVQTNYVSRLDKDLKDTIGYNNHRLNTIAADVAEGQIDPETAREGVQDVLKGSRSSLNRISESMEKDLLSSGVDLQSTMPVQVVSTEGTASVPFNSLADTNAVAAMARDMTGHDLIRVINTGAEATIVGAILDKTVSWGMPTVVADVLESVDDRNSRRRIVGNMAGQFARSADLAIIDAVIDLTGVSALTAVMPNFASEMVRNYRIKKNTPPSNYRREAETLVSVLARLTPDAIYIKRGNETVWNLETFRRLSDDARVLLLSHDTYRPVVLMAEFYPPRTLHILARSLYPQIAFPR